MLISADGDQGKRESLRGLQATEVLDVLEASAPLVTKNATKDAIEDIVSKFDTTGKVVGEILNQAKTSEPNDWSEMDKTEMACSERVYWWLQSTQFELLGSFSSSCMLL